ncbi:MlaC/ttg2D family ABC transporter substrate-binding protein [Thiocapsa roseopersicina]|uniref:Phospholipid transport system substrate-binding protein n=1 Tax=Thiocapsa roseopersicina TaxID=1058 RepID=A0A1H3C4U3_THIRO|nr:ABC transporter substrate-binding protein [Thiocapsa roseopersicina]SDX49192.1 phospholipid transport system substrate-binding protein [Thiocapsa roseopersicina]
MKSRSLVPLLVLLGAAAGASAQPYGYAPPPIPQGYGQMPMPYGGAYPVMPPMPEMPAAAARPARPAAPPARAESTAPARGAGAPAGMPEGPAAEASATLKEGMDKLLGFLARDEVPNRLQVAAFLDREIAPYFDFEAMAKWVAGPASEGMSAEDKEAMAARLEADFLGTLASRLMDYQGQQIRMLQPRMGPRGDVSVNVALLRAQSYPSKLEFRMYKSPTGWRVYDVVANGQSAAAYYRVQFQRMAGQGAGPTS